MEPVIEVSDLCKVYGGVAAVDGVSLLVGRSEVFGVLGPNGAGKTATVDIWLDVRSGYLIAGSGEVEMALGFGTVMAVGVGLLLTVQVYAAARVGAVRRRT